MRANVRSEICDHFDFTYNGVRKLWHQHIPVLSLDRRRAHVLQRIMQGVADPRSKVWGLRSSHAHTMLPGKNGIYEQGQDSHPHLRGLLK